MKKSVILSEPGLSEPVSQPQCFVMYHRPTMAGFDRSAAYFRLALNNK